MLSTTMILIMGCSMGINQGKFKENEFKKTALEIVELYKVSIEYVGYPYDEMNKYESFYSTKYGEKEEKIKERIMGLHFEFFAGANFKDREDFKNKLLAEKLNTEIKEIIELIDNLE